MPPFWKNKNGSMKEASQWKRPGARFDKKKADDKVEFIESCLRHVKGELHGQLFKLERWEREIVRGVFGWIRKSDGTRLFREVYLELPKKNGKSSLGAALGISCLLTEDEPGAEIYSVAGERDQAAIIFDIAKGMVEQHEELSAVTQRFRRSITYKDRAYHVLSSDADTKEGKNSAFVLFDELHIQTNRELYDNLKTGMAARRQPLMFTFTTAGYDRNSLCWEKHEKAIKVNDAIIDDPYFLGIIYAADADHDDWTAPATWKKANPNYGVSVKPDFIREACEEAKRSPSFENTFKRKHLNIWTQQETRWMQLEAWDRCKAVVDYDALKGARCYGGLDLASTTDIAALVLVFPGDVFKALPFFFIPEDAIEERVRRDRVPYDAWVTTGLVTATPGNLIDFRWIMLKLGECRRDFDLKALAFDRWGSQQIQTALCDEIGFTVDEREAANYNKPLLKQFGQGFASMSPPTKDLMDFVLSEKLAHGGNPVLRWMAGNVVVNQDPAGNLKPDKSKSIEKIDGIVALVMALDLAVRFKKAPDTLYFASLQ